MVNNQRLFLGSCFALITTALSFSISAGTLKSMGVDLGLDPVQLGYFNSLWFLGFPISMIIGGLVYNSLGPKNIMQIAFVSHFVGAILTLYAVYNIAEASYPILLFSNLLMGVGCGCTEAACNPMIADAYEGNKRNTMLNRFHMWFPGGIVVGSLLSQFMSTAGFAWQSQYFLVLVPALIYLYLFWGQAFPVSKVEGATSLSENFSAMLKPLFLFMFVCMSLTAISEFGPQKWTGLIMESSGASPMLILALVTGIMAVARFFGGNMVARFGQTGVLLVSSILATLGIFLFSTQTGGMVYVAAIVFALGVAYFWPNMVGFIAERVPKSGALGMSVIGGIGMFSTAIFQPIIGSWIESDLTEQAANGLTGTKLDLAAGQATLSTMITFPAVLIVAFTILYFWQKNKKEIHVTKVPVAPQL
jgi:MFS family permease